MVAGRWNQLPQEEARPGISPGAASDIEPGSTSVPQDLLDSLNGQDQHSGRLDAVAEAMMLWHSDLV